MVVKDRKEAERLRDEAIARGYNASPERWRGVLDQAIRTVAQKNEQFTTDDVWEYLHENEIAVPSETRSIGGAMKRAAAEGIIRPTDRFVNSERPICHSRPNRVWMSLCGGNK